MSGSWVTASSTSPRFSNGSTRMSHWCPLLLSMAERYMGPSQSSRVRWMKRTRAIWCRFSLAVARSLAA